MPRRNISLPDDLDQRARQAGLNVSALTRVAIVQELDRQRRMSSLDAWLDDLDALHGPPSVAAVAAAEHWVRSAEPVLTPNDRTSARPAQKAKSA